MMSDAVLSKHASSSSTPRTNKGSQKDGTQTKKAQLLQEKLQRLKAQEEKMQRINEGPDIKFSFLTAKKASKYIKQMQNFAKTKTNNDNIHIHLLEELGTDERSNFMEAVTTSHAEERMNEPDRKLAYHLKSIIFRTDKKFDLMLQQWSEPPYYWFQEDRGTMFVVFSNLVVILSDDWKNVVSLWPNKGKNIGKNKTDLKTSATTRPAVSTKTKKNEIYVYDGSE